MSQRCPIREDVISSGPPDSTRSVQSAVELALIERYPLPGNDFPYLQLDLVMAELMRSMSRGALA